MTTHKTESTHREENHLANETSPYLLQHAHNPVDWYPWGKEALSRARAENKPIFLSIGYSSCHWCHVMERESFEDDDIASYLNERFVCIKVDREERPDLDEIYMAAVQIVTGSGGWPMSLFLTPELRPFYAGTYFPPEDRFGMPGFHRVLAIVADMWQRRQAEVLSSAELISEEIHSATAYTSKSDKKLSPAILRRSAAELGTEFDPDHGGFGAAPKFPSASSIETLLRHHRDEGGERPLVMVTESLNRMAAGGIYDQIGGGFHRYSTDERWLVPHFEKMLYDQAQLSAAYLDAWLVTRNPLYCRVAVETLDYVLSDMNDPGGGFYCSEDADSADWQEAGDQGSGGGDLKSERQRSWDIEHRPKSDVLGLKLEPDVAENRQSSIVNRQLREGWFYLWTPEEIRSVLGQERGDEICTYYGVTDEGNFEGRSILNIADPTGRPPAFLAIAKAKLMSARARRPRPLRDEKILAAWNGMMISALARAGQSLDEERYVRAAENAASFILENMLTEDSLYRIACAADSSVHEPGGEIRNPLRVKQPAFLDDYAEVANGLIDLYEATFEMRWLDAAERLTRMMIEKFWDADDGGFFYSCAQDHPDVLTRTKPFYDGPVPSGNATATKVLMRLYTLLDVVSFMEKAEEAVSCHSASMWQAPRAYLNMILSAADYLVHPPQEFVLIGPKHSPEIEQMLHEIRSHFIPGRAVVLCDPASPEVESLRARIPLLRGREMIGGCPSAYVCSGGICLAPVTQKDELIRQVDETLRLAA